MFRACPLWGVSDNNQIRPMTRALFIGHADELLLDTTFEIDDLGFLIEALSNLYVAQVEQCRL